MRDADLGFGCAELARAHIFLAVGIGSICKDMVQFFL